MSAPWLGDLPSGWREVALRYLARVETGSRDTVDAVPGGDYPFIIRSKKPLQIDSYSYDTEAVLTAGDGAIGEIFHHLKGKFEAHQRVYVIHDFRGLLGRFFFYYFSSEFSQTVAYGGAQSTVASLRRPMLTDFPVALPPMKAQRAIVDYLDRETAQIDAFIAKNEELITLLTERRAAEIELAVAPQELPTTWKSVQIRRLGPKSESGVSVNGFSVPAEGDEIGVLKTGAVSKGFFDPAENKRVVSEDLGRVAAPVRGGSLIVNRANTPELVGSAGLVIESCPNLYLSDKLWQLTFESANPAYMHYWTKTDAYRSQLRGLSVGASSSMHNLSFKDFLSVRISVPPIRQQAELVARLDQVTGRIDRAIDAARRGANLARERRAALISAAVTGRLETGVAA